MSQSLDVAVATLQASRLRSRPLACRNTQDPHSALRAFRTRSGIVVARNDGHAGSDDEIREYMSGNICRCGAYPNIVKAIAEVKKGGQKI